MIARIAHHLNPIMLGQASSRRVRFFAVVQHTGRRSGRTYTTPVNARPTTDGFVVPMTFGEQAGWFRNVQAAGGCVIRWNGVDYPVVEPEIVDWSVARSAFSPVERVLVPLMGIHRFVRLRHAPANEHSEAVAHRFSTGGERRRDEQLDEPAGRGCHVLG